MTIEDELPPWLREYDTVEFAGTVDEMLGPVRQLLDRFDDHLDPRIAPRPLLDWLASCFGVDAGRHQRAVLAALAEIHDGWATRRGLTALVSAFAGTATVEILDNGGTAWSREPGGTMPDDGSFALVVRIATTDKTAIDVRRLDSVLSTAVPAHLRYRIELVDPRDG